MRSVSALIIFENGYGDHVLSVPTMRCLSERFGGDLDFLGKPKMADLFYTNIKFRMVCESHIRSCFEPSEYGEILNTKYTYLIDLNPYFNENTKKIHEAIAYEYTIGFSKLCYGRLYPNPSLHSVDSMFEIARLFSPGVSINKYTDRLFVSSKCGDVMAKISGLIKGGVMAVVHNETGLSKMVPLVEWNKLVGELCSKFPEITFIEVGRKVNTFRSQQEPSNYLKVDNLNLETCVAIVASADYFIGVDSVFFHIADIMRLKIFGIFITTSVVEWGARFSEYSAHIDCSAHSSFPLKKASFEISSWFDCSIR